MVIRINEAQSKAIKSLVKKYCCNYLNNECLLLDEGEGHKCVQLLSSTGIYCNYFLESVLPNDKKLLSSITDGAYRYTCRNCGNKFNSKERNRRYCEQCAPIIRKRKAAKRKAREREKKKS